MLLSNAICVRLELEWRIFVYHFHELNFHLGVYVCVCAASVSTCTCALDSVMLVAAIEIIECGSSYLSIDRQCICKIKYTLFLHLSFCNNMLTQISFKVSYILSNIEPEKKNPIERMEKVTKIYRPTKHKQNWIS